MRSLLEGSAGPQAELSHSTRIPWLVAVLAILATLVALAASSIPLPVIPAFLPAVMTATALAYLLTALHLFRLYVLTGRRRLAVLGATFALTGLLVSAYLFLFPGVIPLGDLALAAVDSATWLWLLWHLVFPLGIVASLLIDDRERLATPLVEAARNTHVRMTVIVLPLLAVVIATVVFIVDPYLPHLISGDKYSLAHAWFRLPLFVLDALALAFVFWRARSGTILDHWLIVCVLITLCDAQLNLDASYLYNLGWYLSRGLGLVSGSLLLFALLDDFARIYGNLALAHEALRQSAQTDPLTRLSNREHALDRAAALLAAETPFCLAILDLDHFKAVNDTYGHLVGDDVLRAVAARIVRVLKPNDLVGRLGGEEFIVLLVQVNLLQARTVAERILVTVRSSPITTRTIPVSLTASIGLASALPGEPLDHLLARADAALYQAKRDGRDRLSVAS